MNEVAPASPPPLSPAARTLIALAVVAVDFALFAVPLAALLLAWVILVNPPWAHRFLARLGPPPGS